MHSTNILLMEDDPIISEDIKNTLIHQGYRVVSGFPEVFDRKEEFPDNIHRMITDSQIGLVLMDINLHSLLDGIDLVKQIHKKSDIPIIYMSGISKPETVRRAKETGPYAYLLKPFSTAQLHSQVEMTLQLYHSTQKRKTELEDKTGVWHLLAGPGGIQTSFSWLSGFGFNESSIKSQEDFFKIIHPDDLNNLRFAVQVITRKIVKKRSFEYRVIDPTGETHWILSKIVDARKKNANEFAYTILSLDTTHQKIREAELVYDSSHDSLTGIPNRKVFMTELNKLLKETGVLQKNFALIFSDLDNFKRVNDEHGHETGDELLKIVAGRFQQAIKKKDIIARFGGDEFAFIIRDLKRSADIHYCAQRIVNSLNAPIVIGNLQLRTSVSLGVAMPEAVSGNAESLLKNADKAMYQAKKDKSMRYWLFRPNMESSPSRTPSAADTGS